MSHFSLFQCPRRSSVSIVDISRSAQPSCHAEVKSLLPARTISVRDFRKCFANNSPRRNTFRRIAFYELPSRRPRFSSTGTLVYPEVRPEGPVPTAARATKHPSTPTNLKRGDAFIEGAAPGAAPLPALSLEGRFSKVRV
jgi:hypothetical protein